MSFHSSPLIAWTPSGLYCELGGFYIDPHRAVDVAIVTHAHSDHARRGSRKYICEKSGIDLLRTRLGKKIDVEGYGYKEEFYLGGVKVSFHSAGHILGSSQVRIEGRGEVWVASGDYKRDHDPSCEPFEVVKCDTFITEATFGAPGFVWNKNLEHGRMIHEWWMRNASEERNSILFGYSLGKAQRILAELAPYAHRPVLIHHTICELTECYRREGRHLAQTIKLKDKINELIFHQKLEGELILVPPSAMAEYREHFGRYQTAFASGWMSGGGFGRGRYDHGFVMSDHGDWNDLNQTIEDTGARRVFVQHRDGALISHLNKKGIEAYPVETLQSHQFVELGGTNLMLL